MNQGKNWMLENITRCRSCGSGRLDSVFEMGPMPLANALRNTKDVNMRFPLTLLFCEDCSLVQIRETVDKGVLFNRDYVYYSSQSETMVESAKQLVDHICWVGGIPSGSLVMEAASNDGYLLQHYVKMGGIDVIGVDPAAECAKIAETKGVKTDVEFFTAAYAEKYRGRVDVFHANNVLAHVEKQNDFVRGISIVLKDDGLAIIEVPYLGNMIEQREFDTIYHEHLCYFSLTSLQKLLNRHDLSVACVEELPIHGGTIRVWARKCRSKPDDHVRYMLAEEQKRGMHVWRYYADFGARVNMLGADLWRLFDRIHRGDPAARVAGYGAAAKGNQLLSYFDIDFLSCVFDSTPAKQGKFMAGVNTPILNPTSVEPERSLGSTDCILVLAWNFKDEIMAKHPQFKGKWIVPIPDVQII